MKLCSIMIFLLVIWTRCMTNRRTKKRKTQVRFLFVFIYFCQWVWSLWQIKCCDSSFPLFQYCFHRVAMNLKRKVSKLLCVDDWLLWMFVMLLFLFVFSMGIFLCWLCIYLFAVAFIQKMIVSLWDSNSLCLPRVERWTVPCRRVANMFIWLLFFLVNALLVLATSFAKVLFCAEPRNERLWMEIVCEWISNE